MLVGLKINSDNNCLLYKEGGFLNISNEQLERFFGYIGSSKLYNSTVCLVQKFKSNIEVSE